MGHIYVTYVVMGWDGFVNVGGWNAMAWGNIGVTAGLFITRCLYLLGAFGKDRVVDEGGKTKKKA